MRIKRISDPIPLRIIKQPKTEQINFKALLMNSTTVDYKKDRCLVKQIKKFFADGIKIDNNPEEEASLRKSAYCLSLGLSPQFLEEH